MSFKWTVEFEIDDIWVADGFEMTAGRAKSMIDHALPYANDWETKVRIVKKPDGAKIAEAQGYK